jgi:hypothetical protein
MPAPEPPKDKEKDPAAPMPAPPMPEPKKDDPKPPAELAPPPMPPRADVGPIGKYEKSLPTPVLLRIPDPDTLTRVTPDDPIVQSGHRLAVLPGYKAMVKLDNGVGVELWGNVPDLLPAPLLEAAVTPHAPPAGFDADLTVHTGRVYLTARKPGGGKVRLRFDGQVWDVTLPDEKAEAAFEVTHALVPGAAAEPPQAAAALGVVAGTAGLTVRFKTIPEIKAGEVVSWDSKGAGLTGPRKLDAAGGRPSTYFARYPLPPDATQAKLTLAALDEFSKKLTAPGRAKVVVAELIAEKGDRATAADVANMRVGVFAAAALGDIGALVEELGDANRAFARELAVSGLQSCLAADPERVPVFRQALIDQSRLTDEQADAAVRLLRGFTPAEFKSGAVLDKLVDSLGSPAVCVRELAFMNLITGADPDARSTPGLSRFDAGGRDADRDATAKAWKRRVEELKKKAAMPEGK